MQKIIKYIFIIILASLFLAPIIVTVTSSFMTLSEINIHYGGDNEQTKIISIIPDKIALNQYYELLIEKYKYLNMFWNSIKLSVIITIFHVAISIITAYAFAKIEFRGRDTLFFMYIIVMMMPFQVTLLPNYLQARFLHTINTYFSIIFPSIFGPFGVFLLRQFIKYIPDEFIEAVVIESNSIKDILTIAIIPTTKSGIIALAVLTFADNWNMVEQPLVLLSDTSKYPLSVAINSIIEHSSDIAFAGSVIYMIPIIILFVYFEEQIVKGLSNVKF